MEKSMRRQVLVSKRKFGKLVKLVALVKKGLCSEHKPFLLVL